MLSEKPALVFQPGSSGFPLLLIDGAEFVFIRIGVVTMECEHLRNEPSARAAVEMHYNIEGVAYIALDGPIRELDSTLKDATRKPGEALLGRCRVDGRETARVTCIENLQK